MVDTERQRGIDQGEEPVTYLNRDRLVESLLRDLDRELERYPALRAFAERVADTILTALTEHERRLHMVTPEFGEEERNG
uniref:Uncharacterized protein n=1 Tax=Thermomicrobium roseum TaxID=500 RepID=A0A7C5VUJ0_THERO